MGIWGTSNAGKRALMGSRKPSSEEWERLRESEARLSLLAKATSDAIWDFDLLEDRMWWSEGLESLFGYTPAEASIDLQFWRDRLHPEDRERVVNAIDEIVRTTDRDRYVLTYRFRRAGGAYAHVEDRGFIFRDESGKAVRMVGGMTDRTIRMETQERMNLLASALNSAGEPVLIANREGRIVWVNNAFTKLTGYTLAEATGKTPGRLLKSGKHDEEFYKQLWSSIRAGKTWSDEMLNRRKDGSRYPVWNTITPVTGPHGEISHFIAIQRDLSEEKRREANLLRAQRMQSIGTLAGGIAHDLNNLMSPVLMGTGLLRNRVREPEMVKVLDLIEDNIERGAALIRQLLTFARGTQGEHERVDLKRLIEDVRLIVQNTFPKRIDFEVEHPQQLPSCRGDYTQLHQVMVNLCVNARDAMPEGGELRIRVADCTVSPTGTDLAGYITEVNPKAGDYVKISVIDTGCGMTGEVIERIFEPFYTTKELGKGTGLGLSTVQGIVKSHGGFVQVESVPGQGSAFHVHLPAAETPADAGAKAPEKDADEPPLGQGELIVLVDDEEAILETTSMILVSAGYRVVTAGDGIEAFAVISRRINEVDLIITDLMMPRMEGPALIEAVSHIKPDIPFIASSGLTSHHSLSDGVRGKIRRFIQKPCPAGELLQAVDQALRGKARR